MRLQTARAAVAGAVFATFCLAVVAAEEQALEQDVWGYFRPAKRPPRAFANIVELHLAGRGEYGWKASPPNYGMLRTSGKSAVTFALKQPVIEGLGIRFTTETMRGISYEFTGSLARADFSRGGIPLGEVMLRGRMRKLHNGKQLAVAQLSFVFEEGG